MIFLFTYLDKKIIKGGWLEVLLLPLPWPPSFIDLRILWFEHFWPLFKVGPVGATGLTS
jgi:hypothetical protein